MPTTVDIAVIVPLEGWATMKAKLAVFAASLSLLCAASVGPVSALVITAPPEFIIYESPGNYDVVNNSNNAAYSPVTIIGFAVTNPAAGSLGAFANTEQAGWVGLVGQVSFGGPFSPAFGYFDSTFYNGGAFNGTPSGTDIGPGQSSNLFSWGVGVLASDGLLYTSDANGNIGTTGPLATTVTPLPSTWAMMLIGLVGLGVVGYRRNKTIASLAAA